MTRVLSVLGGQKRYSQEIVFPNFLAKFGWTLWCALLRKPFVLCVEGPNCSGSRLGVWESDFVVSQYRTCPSNPLSYLIVGSWCWSVFHYYGTFARYFAQKVARLNWNRAALQSRPKLLQRNSLLCQRSIFWCNSFCNNYKRITLQSKFLGLFPCKKRHASGSNIAKKFFWWNIFVLVTKLFLSNYSKEWCCNHFGQDGRTNPRRGRSKGGHKVGIPWPCYRGHLGPSGPKSEKESENEFPGPFGPGAQKAENVVEKESK